MNLQRTFFVVSLTLLAFVMPSSAENLTCGQPISTGEQPKASDALFILKTSVGSSACVLCACDVNASGSITAPDALLTLRKSVGQSVALKCLDCASSAMITPAGGTLLSHNGRVEIEVPPGALESPENMTIEGLAPAQLPGDLEDGAYDAYDLGPDGLTFDPPLNVTYHLPDDTFDAIENGVAFKFPLLGTASGNEPEPLGDLASIFDTETGNAKLTGTLSHYSPLTVIKGGGGAAGVVSLQVSGVPTSLVDGAPAVEFSVRVRSSAVQLPRPDDVNVTTRATNQPDTPCTILAVTEPSADDLTQDGDAWVGTATIRCLGVGRCDIFVDAEIEDFGLLGHVLFKPTIRKPVTCVSGGLKAVPAVGAQESEQGYAFHGPFGPIEEFKLLAAVATKMGSILLNVDDEETEEDLDDEETISHLGAFPLRHCSDACTDGAQPCPCTQATQAWMHHSFGGVSVWPFNEKTKSFGDVQILDGAYSDAWPATVPADGIPDTVYMLDEIAKTIRPLEFESKTGSWTLGEPTVTYSAFGFGHTPFSLYPFPNGAAVTVTIGDGVHEGKLLFHPAGNPGAPGVVVGDIGVIGRRVRCAICNGSTIYTCAATGANSNRLTFALVDPVTGSASITDDVTTGVGPIGTAIFPNEDGPGCYAVSANNGIETTTYTTCEVDNDGKASNCETKGLPEECPFSAHVGHAPDGRLVFTCRNTEYVVVGPGPD